MTRAAARRRRTSGQTLAEFAIVAPIFFLLLFSVVQFGLIMAAQNGLVDGVRDAARRAATYRINGASFDISVFPAICQAIDGDLETRLKSEVIGYAKVNRTRSIVYEWQQNPGSGEYFLVAHIKAWYRNPLYVPLVSYFLDSIDTTVDGKLTLTAEEQMRVENPVLDDPGSYAAHDCAAYLP